MEVILIGKNKIQSEKEKMSASAKSRGERNLKKEIKKPLP